MSVACGEDESKDTVNAPVEAFVIALPEPEADKPAGVEVVVIDVPVVAPEATVVVVVNVIVCVGVLVVAAAVDKSAIKATFTKLPFGTVTDLVKVKACVAADSLTGLEICVS
jgi:hypothetical protein